MKILSWLLLFCMFTNAFAATGTIAELEQALNEYQYSMVVDWDQKDKAEAEKISKTFFDQMDVLFTEKNLSHAEVVKYIESRVKDPKKLADLKVKIEALTSRADSKAKLAKILSESLGSMEMQGASWNGGVSYALAITGILAVAVLFAYQIVWSLNHYCAAERRYESCSEVQNTHCGYDYDGDWYCEDTWGTHTECSDETSCERWEKR